MALSRRILQCKAGYVRQSLPGDRQFLPAVDGFDPA
jgi:hypothetical protein